MSAKSRMCDTRHFRTPQFFRWPEIHWRLSNHTNLLLALWCEPNYICDQSRPLLSQIVLFHYEQITVPTVVEIKSMNPSEKANIFFSLYAHLRLKNYFLDWMCDPPPQEVRGQLALGSLRSVTAKWRLKSLWIERIDASLRVRRLPLMFNHQSVGKLVFLKIITATEVSLSKALHSLQLEECCFLLNTNFLSPFIKKKKKNSLWGWKSETQTCNCNTTFMN